jgi:hypothetical protein
MIHICAIAKNEIMYVGDWVDYHFDLGINRITLYIHESDTEPYRKKLPHKEIELIEWNFPLSENFSPQISAYNHFVARNQKDDDYTFLIDIFDLDNIRIMKRIVV